MSSEQQGKTKAKYEINLANYDEMKSFMNEQSNIKADSISLIFKTIDVDNFTGIQRFFQYNSSKVTHFQLIHECSNTFTDKDCENMADYLKNMQNLQTLQLHLRLNKIYDGIFFITKVLSKLQYLENISIRMQSNGINSLGLQSISSSLSELPKLQEVELLLLGNEITDLTQFKCGPGFANLKKFHFQINKNPVTIEQCIVLVDELSINCQRLEYLVLELQGLHWLQEDSMRILLEKISKMDQLQSLSLDLENSRITPDLVEMFTERITHMKLIHQLSLNFKNNQLKDIGCAILKRMLLQMPNLTSLCLILDVNQITTIGIEDLIEGISALKFINQLSFSIMANHSDKINSIYSQILTKTQYLSKVQIHASGRFKKISEEFANYYSQIYIMLLQMTVFINNYNEYQLFNPCFIMQDLFYD